MNTVTSSLPGYESIKELIPDGHFLSFTHIWALGIQSYVTNANELEQRLVLDLGGDWNLDDQPLVRITMLRPGQWSIPTERQICGLDFKDIRNDGLEDLNYEVYDYEISAFRVKCHSIELSKIAKPSL